MTNLPNQSYLTEHLSSLCEAQTPATIYVIAIDRFKAINDSYGHKLADELLIKISEKLSELTKAPHYTLARLDGPEFCIVCSATRDFKESLDFVHTILDSFTQAFHIRNREIFITSSIGISLFPDDSTDALHLLQTAKSAMHNAKIESKNSYQFYEQEMTQNAHERLELETQLRHAIQDEEFVVYYQAQYNSRTNQLTGMEALVRWIHPTKGMISPAKFIPLAEESGLIIEIDRLVMKEAMAQFKKWYSEGLKPGILSMNLAMKQLEQSDFIEYLQMLLDEADSNKPYIALEVTESQIMQNPEESIVLLNQIRALGINLAIDDFGTGHSSLAYLKKLPVQKLKIDQSFVRGLPEDKDDIAIVRSVISLAKNLNMSVLAEGVETESQLQFLLENGCEDIQGYYYAKPMPAKQMLARLKSDERCCYI